LSFIEADHGGDPVREQCEAARHQAREGAMRAHSGHKCAAAGRQPDVLIDDFVNDLGRQAFQQGHALPQGRLERDVASHGAFGNRRDVILEADVRRQFIDAFLADHGGIHVGQKKLLAPGTCRLDHCVNAVAEIAQLAGECALVYGFFRAKGDVGR
jgi:hypothetical protein